MSPRTQLILFLHFYLFLKVASQWTKDTYCNMARPITMNSPACCKFPSLFPKKTYVDCKSQALRGTVNGTSAFFEDSCFLDCVFQKSGINTKKEITGKFIQDALPFTMESPKSIISWSGSANTIATTCNKELGLSDNRQIFTRVYRKALSAINPERPICNLRLAAFWDCVYKNFFKTCYNEFITMSDSCERLRLFTTQCEWWAEN